MVLKSKIIFVAIAISGLLSACNANLREEPSGADMMLYEKHPAKDYTESTPMGNGLMGAMIFGNPDKDRIILNEISLWTGGEQDADKEDAHKYLPAIQKFLLEGKNKEAQEMLLGHFTCKGVGSNRARGEYANYGCYQVLGDLWIDWKDTLTRVSDYKRTLDIGKAVASTSWKRGGNLFRQEAFASMEDNVLIIKYTAPKGLLDFTIHLSREKNFEVGKDGDGIVMKGQLPNGDQPGMKYAAKVAVKNKGGTVTVGQDKITVSNAGECILYCSVATNYNMEYGKLDSSQPVDKINEAIGKAQERKYKDALSLHIREYKKYFDNSSLRLENTNPRIAEMSTQERLIHYAQGGADPLLPVLAFNYGKYLLIGSSRKNGLPSNLQGLWAEEYQTPWNGDYHMNINIQMNYWPAEITGLSELTLPLHNFISRLVPNGQKTAKAYYNAGGWVVHVITNPWHFTSPGEGASWGSTMTGGAWMCEHIWEHFSFTRDTAFLRTYYPVMKGSADFLKSVLIEEPEHHYLVTAPSNSPEHAYIMPNGFKGNTCMGPTMDMQICRELFSNVSKAAGILGIDQAYAQELAQIKSRLAPNRIGANGDINEWLDDWEDAAPHHHHTSHLYGLYPYDEITPWDTPELAGAAAKTLEYRGDGTVSGWSSIWRICLWARLEKGEQVGKLIRKNLRPLDTEGKDDVKQGNMAHNLFSCFYYKPYQKIIFQIDANMGFTAAISELLLQSHGKEEIIRFLPALPTEQDWQNGEINGFHARGAFRVGFSWKNGKTIKGKIFSEKGLPCKVFFNEFAKVTDEKGKPIAEGKGLVTFPTRPRESYSFSMVND